MKPTLIVEGKIRKVVSMSFNEEGAPTQVMIENDTSFEYHDVIDNPGVKLVWEDRYSPVYEAIRKRIHALEEEQIDIALRYIEESELPFQEQNELKKMYDDSNLITEGLTESLGIVRQVETGQTFEERMEQFAESFKAAFGGRPHD